MIHLVVGRLEIDWGKNSGFSDHSALFQPTDLAKVPYYYVKDDAATFIDESGEFHCDLITELREGLSKTLGLVVDRIDLLGHTLASCEKEFRYLSELYGFDPERFRFQDLVSALACAPVETMSADYGDGEDFGKFFRRQIATRLRISTDASGPWGLEPEVCEAMENLSAYTILQLISQNPRARELPVAWQFADVEEGGWAKRTDFVRPLDRSNRFLIVTEGGSDAAIIKHAWDLLRPHVSDFFEFVDMEEGYPFGGAGNLFRFVQGLISISIQNDVVVIYDNDIEGMLNYERSRGLNVPANIRILKLPDRYEFENFSTTGPSGCHKADINGRAAAIECYLGIGEASEVRWTSYNTKAGQYHGELLNKATYMKEFLNQRSRTPGYDYERIESVLSMIVENCIQMREQAVLAGYE